MRPLRSIRRPAALLLAAAPLVACAGPDAGGTAAETLASRTFELDGAELHYLAAGPAGGRPVLLLHGRYFHAGTWRRLGTLGVLARHGHRVLALDLPGYGRSEALEHQAGDLLARMLPVLDLDRPVVLVAPSMSGLYALPLVVEHPELVAGFVAVAPAGVERHASDLSRILAPTLLIWGEEDRIVPLAVADRLAAAVPGSSKLVVPGAGHPVYVDRPDEFHRALLDFLASLPGAQAAPRRRGRRATEGSPGP